MWSRRSVDLHTLRRMNLERHVWRCTLVSTYTKNLLIQICIRQNNKQAHWEICYVVATVAGSWSVIEGILCLFNLCIIYNNNNKYVVFYDDINDIILFPKIINSNMFYCNKSENQIPYLLRSSNEINGAIWNKVEHLSINMFRIMKQQISMNNF